MNRKPLTTTLSTKATTLAVQFVSVWLILAHMGVMFCKSHAPELIVLAKWH